MPSDFELFASITVFLCVVLWAIWYAWQIKRSHFTEPIYQFLFFYCLFVLPLPLRASVTRQPEGDVTDHLPLLLPYMPWAVILCSIGLPLFIWAYYSQLSNRLGLRLPRPAEGRNSRTAFVCLALVSIFLLTLLARDAGNLIDFILLGYGSSAETFGRGYLAVGFPWLWVASFFLLYRYSLHKTRTDLLLFFIACMSNLLINFLMGNRGLIVYFAIAVWLFWHHAIRPISTRKLALLGIAAFLSLNLVGIVRGSKFESVSNFWQRTTDAFDRSRESNDALFYTLTIGEFVVPFETLPQMIRSVGSSLSPQLGATYLRAPSFWIPGALYPSRPLPLSNWYMKEFYGSGLGLNENRSFFFLSEGYLNFGTVGVLATMIGWGLFLGACRSYERHNRGNPGAVLIYAFTVAFIFRGVAGEFVSIFVGLPEQILSAVIVGLWITNRKRRIIQPSPLRQLGKAV